MNILRVPRWALSVIETPIGPLSVVALEAGSTDSYEAIRTQLTLAGCISRISPLEWQQCRWPDSGRLQVHYTDRQVISLGSPSAVLHLPGGFEASDEWLETTTIRGHTLFAVVPPAAIAPHGQPSPQSSQTTTDEIAIMLVDLAHSRQLTAGLATAVGRSTR